MLKNRLLRTTLIAILVSIALVLAGPFAGGLYYTGCGDRYVEQEWLDRAVAHLIALSLRCDDPDLQGVLDYTIRRYHKIGPWDVMVMPLANGRSGWRTLGCNCPWCPGITIDPEVLTYPISDGAMILTHEAMHDYWPYIHPLVDAQIHKMEQFQEHNQWLRP